MNAPPLGGAFFFLQIANSISKSTAKYSTFYNGKLQYR